MRIVYYFNRDDVTNDTTNLRSSGLKLKADLNRSKIYIQHFLDMLDEVGWNIG